MSLLGNLSHSRKIEKHALSICNAARNRSPAASSTLRIDTSMKRPTCPRCSKPVRLCLCIRIRTPGIDNPVSVVILQHSLESKHALNSARIAKLGFKNVSVITVSDVDSEAQFLVRMLEHESESPVAGEKVDNVAFGRTGYSSEEDDNGLLDLPGKRIRILGSADGEKSVNGESSIASEVDGNAEGRRTVRQKNQSSGSVSRDGPAPVITALIQKYGVISNFWHSWMLEKSGISLDFHHFLSCRAAEVISKGFVVKKLRCNQMGSEKEFELDVPAGSVLLFPSQEAVSVHDAKANGLEVKNLIVLDGTWAKAKRMYRENPWLKLLPHISLDLGLRSLYREVRRQPNAGFLSTIESIVYAMKAIGKCPEGTDELLDVFSSMVEDQRRCKEERLRSVSED